MKKEKIKEEQYLFEPIWVRRNNTAIAQLKLIDNAFFSNRLTSQ